MLAMIMYQIHWDDMDDLRKLALQLMEIEKRFLLEEREEYGSAIVVVITPEGRYSEEVEFDSEDDKARAYAAIVNRAKDSHASAIITINSSFKKSVPSDDEVAAYRWGDLERGAAQRAITLTISGPSIKACCLSLPYSFQDGAVVVGELSDFDAARVGLLPGWP